MPRLPAAVALALALVACTPGESTNIARFEEGSREPAAALTGPPLGDLEVEELEPGRPAVVAFWGSWCGPCRSEQPHLNEAYEEYRDRVAFIGVDTRNDQTAAALAFIEEFDVPYGSIVDERSKIADAWGVRIMPATMVVDAEGRIAAQIIGGIRSAEQLTDLLDEVLA